MNKRQTSNSKDFKKLNYEAKKMNTANTPNKKRNKDLPWWVELLFVQIGLPDNLLVKILKAKRKSKELIKNDKKPLIIFLFIITSLVYFYPVIRYAKNRLNCEETAKNYIIENKNIVKINKRTLRMLSTNFCNGGEEIYKIEN